MFKNYNIDFVDLYSLEGLRKIDEKFLNFIKNKSKNQYEIIIEKRKKNEQFSSDEIINLSIILQEFLIEIFDISSDFTFKKDNIKIFKNLFEFKRNFIQRISLNKFKESYFLENKFDYEEFEKKHNIIDDFSFYNICKNLLLDDNLEIEEFQKYAASRCYFKPSDLFSYPQKTDLKNLIKDLKIKRTEEYNIIYDQDAKNRDIRKNLSYNKDNRLLEHSNYHTNYCINCHKNNKDSCRTGLKKENNFIKNELGNLLSGCPLEQKISEMNYLYSDGDFIASLSVIVLDNPMVALTGFRICNDCSKACIFQKQDAVDIPSIETKILMDVLSLPYGFEIYSLLTRWNILSHENYLPKEKINKKILVVGLGPSGIAISHYMLNMGVIVHAIDALSIKNISDEILNIPIRDIGYLKKYYEDNYPFGFGGVAEYGITQRWDKVNLLIIRLILQRRSEFSLQGGIRFGGNINFTDSIKIFDHIAFCAGSGIPKIPKDIENIDAGNVRTASDFLMALNLGAMEKENSKMNFFIKLPAIVIGAGLTAIDASTEILAYYPVYLQKIFNNNIDESVLSDYEKIHLKEFSEHNEMFEKERNLAKIEKRNPNFINIINQLGGVTLCYRSDFIKSPSYRINHEELESAIKQGVRFIENLSPEKIIKDKYGYCKSVEFKNKNGEKKEINANSIFIATGTQPLQISDFSDEYYNDHISKISILGDMDEKYTGSVVKAMASVKNNYKLIYQSINSSKENLTTHYNTQKPKIFSKTHITEDLYDVIIDYGSNHIPIKPGQYFKIESIEKQFEPIALSPYRFINKNGKFLISFLAKKIGNSISEFLNLSENTEISMMGPCGIAYPTEFFQEKILIITDDVNIGSFLLLAKNLVKNNKIEFIQFVNSKEKIFFYENLIKDVSNQFSIYEKNNIDQNNILKKISLDNKKIFISTNIQLSEFFAYNLLKKIKNAEIFITNYNIVQCMMHGVCGQCYMKNEKTEEIFFSCKHHLNKLENIDLKKLEIRRKQNSLLEKLKII